MTTSGKAPRVTVCIPAYRSGTAIHPTLASVQAQTFEDFQVVVGIEPTGPDAIDPQVRDEFTRDNRFVFVENPRIFGWAGNVGELIGTVNTELFAVLPHDDIWDAQYLTKLVSALDNNPGASVAFADLRRFGSDTILRTIEFDNFDLSTRLFSFFVQGAEAHAWRGLVRKSALESDFRFPENPYLSFAVECEFMQHLILRGEAIRVSEELYKKRGYPADSNSVSSRWRRDLSHEEQVTALEHHRQKLVNGIPANMSGQIGRNSVIAACEIAMWRRGLIFAPINPYVAKRMHSDQSDLRKLVSGSEEMHRTELTRFINSVIPLLPVQS